MVPGVSDPVAVSSRPVEHPLEPSRIGCGDPPCLFEQPGELRRVAPVLVGKRRLQVPPHLAVAAFDEGRQGLRTKESHDGAFHRRGAATGQPPAAWPIGLGVAIHVHLLTTEAVRLRSSCGQSSPDIPYSVNSVADRFGMARPPMTANRIGPPP